MLNFFTKKKLGIAFALGAAATVPAVPTEMELLYSFGTNNPEVFTVTDTVASTTRKLELTYSDVDKDGFVYFSVFLDQKGNEIYVEIPQEKYEAMGRTGGYDQNPTKEEYVNAIEALTTKVEAAVTVDAVTSPSTGGTDGAYTSVTFAHTTNTALQRVMVVGISDFGSDTFTASSTATYNGVSMTLDGSRQQGGYNRVFLYSLANPATGANNVVVTLGGGAATVSQYTVGAMTVYNAQTPLTGLQTAANVGPAEPNVVVTSATGDLVFDVVAEQQKTATLSVGASQTQRWNYANNSRRDGAASTEPGGASITMSWTDNAAVGENWAQVGINIPAYATPTPPAAVGLDDFWISE